MKQLHTFLTKHVHSAITELEFMGQKRQNTNNLIVFIRE